MRLNIGPLTIELSGVTEQEIPVNSRLFLDHKPATKEADRYYTFYFVNRLPLPSNDWQITFQRNDIVVFRKEEQETRLLVVGNLNACYALYQERNERDANIYFIEGLKRELQTDTLFISACAWNVLYLSRDVTYYIVLFWIIVGKPSYSVVLAALANRRMPTCGAGIFPAPRYSMATVPCSVHFQTATTR